MRTRRYVTFLASMSLVVASVHAGAASVPGARVDVTGHCPMPGAVPPEGFSFAGVTDTGDTVRLDVVVGLDGVSRARAREVFEKMAEAYAPLAIEVAPRFVPAKMKPTLTTAAGAAGLEVHYATTALRLRLGGEVPKGADVAYLATDKDLYVVEDGEPNFGYGGFAECIGGIRNPGTAFAVGEAEFGAEDETIGGVVRPFMNASAKIAAHEIGHLLGGRHEEANCAEGYSAGSVGEGDVASPCTLMWGFSGFSLNFGTVERAVVRGYAVEFAAP